MTMRSPAGLSGTQRMSVTTMPGWASTPTDLLRSGAFARGYQRGDQEATPLMKRKELDVTPTEMSVIDQRRHAERTNRSGPAASAHARICVLLGRSGPHRRTLGSIARLLRGPSRRIVATLAQPNAPWSNRQPDGVAFVSIDGRWKIRRMVAREIASIRSAHQPSLAVHGHSRCSTAGSDLAGKVVCVGKNYAITSQKWAARRPARLIR